MEKFEDKIAEYKEGDLKSSSCFLKVMTDKTGYTATQVVCGWAGAVIKKTTHAFGQEQYCKNRL